jgi:hypothetical protein
MPSKPAPPKSPALADLGAFLLFVGLAAFGAWDLFQAATAGRITTRHGWADLHTEPTLFWNSVFKAGLATVVALGLLIMLLIRMARRRRQ